MKNRYQVLTIFSVAKKRIGCERKFILLNREAEKEIRRLTELAEQLNPKLQSAALQNQNDNSLGTEQVS